MKKLNKQWKRLGDDYEKMKFIEAVFSKRNRFDSLELTELMCDIVLHEDNAVVRHEAEKIPASEGYNYIPIIAEALCQKKALSVKYKAPIARRSSTLILHPQGVKEYQKKFFLLATKDKEREVRSYDVTCLLEQPVILEKEALKLKDFSVESFKIESNT
jgi:hypothetical protein